MTLALLISAVLFSLGVSALCSLLEAALLSLTPSDVAQLKKRRPAAGAIWEKFKSNVERPISVILICNTASHTIGATVAGAQFEQLMEEYGYGSGWGVLLFGIGFTLLMLQFTEILPKTLGVKFNQLVAAVSARPMAFLVKVMEPLLAIIRFINRPFETGGSHHGAAVSVDEIATLAALARGTQVIDERQERMIKAAGRMGEVRVRQVMTPRRDVHYLKVEDNFAEILKTLRDTPYSRLPVVEESLDKVVGVVHLRDVFNALKPVPGRMHIQPDPDRPDEVMAIASDRPGGDLHAIGSGEVDLPGIMRDVPFVPETQPLGLLLKQFQEGGSHLAIVVNEHGSVEGVVTLEDVLEELVGDIEDEFDEGEHVYDLVKHDDGTITCGGDVPLRELAEMLDIDVEALDAEDVVTVGGWLTRELGRWPIAGDEARIAQSVMRAEKVANGRLEEARVTPYVAPTEEAE